MRAASIAADNDAFNFWIPIPRPDHDYTSGVRAVVELDGAPGWGRLLPSLRPCTGKASGGACLATRWELGQEIYTPLKDGPDPVPGERPFAGWLYGAATAQVLEPERRRTLEVEAGVTGPPSMGESVQNRLHRVAGYRVLKGWDDQLPFEPGAVIRYTDTRLLVEPGIEKARLGAVTAGWGIAAGNVRTAAHVGMRAQAGYGVAHPWRLPHERRGPGAALYATGGVRGEWVARDLFLDGSTFRNGPRVRKLPLVAEAEAGAGLRIRNLVVEYAVVTRGREYRTQRAAHRYSTITVTLQRSY